MKMPEEIEESVCKSRCKTYERFRKLVSQGKTDKAREDYLELVRHSPYRSGWFCPKCHRALFISDLPSKDYTCLWCDKYYKENDLHDSTDDFLRKLGYYNFEISASWE